MRVLGTGAAGSIVYTIIGAAALLNDLRKAQWLLGDRGYDADWFRDALQSKGTQPCIPGRRSRLEPIRDDKRRYRRLRIIGWWYIISLPVLWMTAEMRDVCRLRSHGE